MERNHIGKIDFLKIDVEGSSYEVLQGFGNRLSDVCALQVEAEHFAEFCTYDKIDALLKENGFELVEFHRTQDMRQSDSFWVQQSLLKL